MISDSKLKEILIDTEVVEVKDVEEACAIAKKEKRSFSEVLVEKDYIPDSNLGQLIADALGFEYVDLKKQAIPDQGLDIVPEIMAKKQQIIIFDINKKGISLAMADPSNLEIIRLVEKKSGYKVNPYFVTERDLRQALIKYHRDLSEEFKDILQQNVKNSKSKKTSSEDVSIIKIVDAFIRYGYENLASDIHIEPTEKNIAIRFRLDGMLYDAATIPKELLEPIISRIKILARLRTDEHRAAQDGKITLPLEEEDLDIRVSIVPITEGEKVVMRLLSEKNRQFSLDDLGFSENDVSKIRKAINSPHGMILVTGPTGSGKTTTLYAILKILNKRDVNISTIEDPVEYDMMGVNQIQVNAKTNLTFAAGLRSIVRQDPDIIMVGEIRDQETAGISVNAALTGHLVLSTLHTNDAATTLPRLIDMKIEPFLIASTVNIAIAQRLVRKVCTQCLMSDIYEGKVLDELKEQVNLEAVTGQDVKKIKKLRFYKGKGCPACNNTGYKGRIGVFELLTINEAMRKLIVNKADAGQIKAKAVELGMTTMMQDGVAKAMQGMTTIEEVLRVTAD
ncbi:MAG: GspE/PulE family protein [Patescibacteria group bacterium]